MITIESLRQKVAEVTLRRKMADMDLDRISREYESILAYKEHIDSAQRIIQAVAIETQSAVRFNIEQIVNTALDAVFGGEYVFKLEFEIKRNKTEASLALYENGHPIDPMRGGSGGVKDILSFSLRIALLLISKNKKVLSLDEIMKGVSSDLRDKAYQILSTLSSKLGIQCIMVSHDPQIFDIADRTIRIAKLRSEEWSISQLL